MSRDSKSSSAHKDASASAPGLLTFVSRCASNLRSVLSRARAWSAVKMYQLRTMLRAIAAVYTMPPELVRAFFGSYHLFDREVVDPSAGDGARIVNYYAVLNHLCAIGEVEKMYIPPVMDLRLGVYDNQLLFERQMASQIDARAGMKVLDCGCGRGRIAAHVASTSGAHVTGINIDPTQIENARRNAEVSGLSAQLRFVVHDFNNPLPFADNTFDAMYQVQAFTYAADRDALFKELFRVLKPGAKISMLDWFKLDAYNEHDRHHLRLLHAVKPLIGAVNTPHPSEWVASLTAAGFTVTLNANASKDAKQWQLIRKADNYFVFLTKLIHGLDWLRLIPRHIRPLFDRFTQDGEAFIEADQLGLFTTCHQICAQKPLGA